MDFFSISILNLSINFDMWTICINLFFGVINLYHMSNNEWLNAMTGAKVMSHLNARLLIEHFTEIYFLLLLQNKFHFSRLKGINKTFKINSNTTSLDWPCQICGKHCEVSERFLLLYPPSWFQLIFTFLAISQEKRLCRVRIYIAPI